MNSFLKVLPTLFICFPFFTQYGICSTSLQAHVIIFFLAPVKSNAGAILAVWAPIILVRTL